MSVQNSSTTTNPYKSDVLHSTGHAHLTPEQIARAVERHQRQHPDKTRQPMKTDSRD